ncbi:MAG: FeoA family protein [Limnochordia bacterium]
MTEKQQPRPPVSLAALHPGERGTIASIACRGPLKRKLMDMGLTPGTQVCFEGSAPLGDPIIVNTRGYRLALRRREAAEVLMNPESVLPMATPRGPGFGRGRRGMGRVFRRRRRGRCQSWETLT